MYEQEQIRPYAQVVHELLQAKGKRPEDGRLRKDLIAEAGLAAIHLASIDKTPVNQ